jgi:hypothetical protein
MSTFFKRFLLVLSLAFAFGLWAVNTQDVFSADLYCEYDLGGECCSVETSYQPVSEHQGFECPQDSQCFITNYTLDCGDGGDGGGSGGSTPNPGAGIGVSILGLPRTSVSQWTINPGSHNGNGNGAVAVFPSSGGNVYTISNLGVSDCTYSVVNSKGGGSSMTLFPEDQEDFYVYYNCGAPPTVDILANGSQGPVSISPGASATLTWTSTDASSCSASGNWLGIKSTSGSQSTGALSTGAYSYRITCSNSSGQSTSDTVAVNVVENPSVPPTPTITANASGTSCEAIRISWSSYDLSDADGFKVYRDGSLIATLGVVSYYENTGLTPGVSYSYTVRAFNSNGDSAVSNTSASTPSASCTPPGANAPVVDLSANPISVNAGGNTTLSWVTENNPSSCIASASPAHSGWSGGKNTSNSSQSVSTITQTTTFTLTCTNAFGSNQDSVTVTALASGLLPVVTLSASDTTINSGQSSTLSWTVAGGTPTYCAATGNPAHPQWVSAKPMVNGSQVVSNITNSGYFYYFCQNAYGTSNFANVIIVVTPTPNPPTLSFIADPTIIASGGNTTLTWNVDNANTCTASASPANAQWTGAKSTSGGAQSVTNLTQTTTFSLVCDGSGGSVNQSQLVTVTPTNATISVSTNNSSAGWTINPGGLTGSGTSGGYGVSPNAGGTVYTLSPASIPSHSVAVTSTRNGVSGGGSAVTTFPGDTVSFNLVYTSTAPSFNYSLSNSGNLSVTKGSNPVSVINTITRTITAGATQPVTISVSGLPSGVSASVANNPCSPTCSSAVTLTVSSSAPTGTHPITVTGSTAGVSNKTTAFNLTIQPADDLSVVIDPQQDPPTHVGDTNGYGCVVSGGVPPYIITWTGTDVPALSTGEILNITYQTTGAKVLNCTAVDSGGQNVTSNDYTFQVSLDPEFIEF